MWVEVESLRDKKVLVNFDNVARIDPVEPDRWMLTFVDKDIARLKIKATAAELKMMLEVE